MSTQTQDFGKWRSRLWPVHRFELKKFLPMVGLLFLTLFNYTILRDTKDSLVVPASGAETITFLKLWGVLPMAALFMICYAKLSNILSKKKLFISVVMFFVSFFALFAFVLYPLREYLHPTELADRLQAALPGGFSGFIAIFRNWTFSLFYIFSELWGSAVLSLLFWGFANDITKVSESKRFYSLFGMFANLALMVSGPLIIYFSNISHKVAPGVDAWQVSLNYLIGMVVVSGLLICGIYAWMHKNVLSDKRFYNPEEVRTKKSKPKMSIGESMKYLMKSKYLGCIALLVICYGVGINLVEVTWKGQLKLQYSDHNAYSAFMGKFSFITGLTTILVSFFIGGNVFRKFGWKKTALVTPIVLLVTGMLFLSFIIFREQLGGFVASMGTTTLLMAVIFGMTQNIMTKSCKYSMFDPTKEAAYIPLDQEQKVKGKAAIDVVGARLGKSGGAAIQSGLILGFGSLMACTPYIALILIGIFVTWFLAARSLGNQFEELTAEQAAESEAAPVTTEAEPAKA